ncbi:MAG TPA: tetratricopeptide repeat protein [Pilimelia sp.]|nr:tetratricopeptide repeat protein [Pilimelia sp.]
MSTGMTAGVKPSNCTCPSATTWPARRRDVRSAGAGVTDAEQHAEPGAGNRLPAVRGLPPELAGQPRLYREAAECFQQVLVLFSRADDRVGQARVAGNLGLVEERQGHYEQAAEYFRQALTLYRAMGDRVGEGMALDNLGDLAMRQGRYHEASDHQRQALTLCRATGDQIGEASALHNLGLIEERRGRYEQAAEYHRQALEINRESGHRVGEGSR